jgi:PhnB protein
MQSVTAKVKPIPPGYHSVTPYLIVDGAPKLIDFLKDTFKAEQRDFVKGPDGRIAHAEVKIGDSIVMLSDATAEFKPIQSQLYVYVDDVDTVYKQALEAGATIVREPKNQFYGDRNASVKDPTGNVWGIATHVEDVPPDEMMRRMKEQSSQ